MSYEEGKERFRQEWSRYSAKLPDFLKDPALAGKWVVFLNDGIVHTADNVGAAHTWAVTHLDKWAGFVVSQIVEPRPVYVRSPRVVR